jgi:hypothetical protein
VTGLSKHGRWCQKKSAKLMQKECVLRGNPGYIIRPGLNSLGKSKRINPDEK